MRKLLIWLLLCASAFGQKLTVGPKVTFGPKVTIAEGTAGGGGAAPSFVQQSSSLGSCSGTINSCTTTLTGAATVGHSLVIAFDLDDNLTISSVTHGTDTASVCGVVTDNVGLGAKTGIYVIGNMADTTTTVTITSTATLSSFFDIFAIEYSGTNTSSPCDATGQSANQGSTGTSFTPGAATATHANAMIIDFCDTENAGGPWGTTGGWNSRQNGNAVIIEDLGVTSASSHNPIITSTVTGHNWTCQQMALDGP